MSSTFQRQDSHYDDRIDPDILPEQWMGRKELRKWRSGTHESQSLSHGKKLDATEQIRVMQKQHDLNINEVGFKHEMQDRSRRLDLSIQVKALNRQLEHRFKLALLSAQMIILTFSCFVTFFYIMSLCKSDYYYTSLVFMLFIFLGTGKLYHDGRLLPRMPMPLQRTESHEIVESQ
ncbi:uncharacterized protein EAE98_009961 [Botrytis deweyae]|uniref:Uncharacterized protein n=1 Tax=Botrytis deweyae TaxID=2478750 RepID=A0ABQ7IA27_9HELO|nr:uncharacterized protein EAE98_009961 [Botrytis deweyae]KAF7917933.1 hypothetical protein EAE98_009961 [Botrytis deweyae]